MNPSVYLETVALCLGDMNESVVFVGGMVRSLLVTDAAVPGARPTFDVDVIFAGALASGLGKLGTPTA